MTKIERVAYGLNLFIARGITDMSVNEGTMYAGKKVSDDDSALLESWGWHWERMFDCWAISVS